MNAFYVGLLHYYRLHARFNHPLHIARSSLRSLHEPVYISRNFVLVKCTLYFIGRNHAAFVIYHPRSSVKLICFDSSHELIFHRIFYRHIFYVDKYYIYKKNITCIKKKDYSSISLQTMFENIDTIFFVSIYILFSYIIKTNMLLLSIFN